MPTAIRNRVPHGSDGERRPLSTKDIIDAKCLSMGCGSVAATRSRYARPSTVGPFSIGWPNSAHAARAALANANLFSISAVPQGVTSQLHVTAGGGSFVSTSHAESNEGHVVLTGSVGTLPYELHLDFSQTGRVVEVTLKLVKPIPLGPYIWSLAWEALPSTRTIDSYRRRRSCQRISSSGRE
jgi:hypothetical protein